MNHKRIESKRQAVKDLLEGKRVERLLYIPNALSISAAKYGYSIPEVITNPVKMAECVGGYRERIGYDGYCAGLATEGYMNQLAGHLPDSYGEINGSGADTVHSAKDLDKLKPYDLSKDTILQNIAETVRLLREREPDEPIYVIFNSPAQTAMKLMGENSGYRAMRKNPKLFLKVMNYVEEDLIVRCLYLWELGVDYLWEPIPCFSGNCISRTLYEQLICQNNARFNKRLVDKGVKIVIHTCGKYGDRYDLVRQEYGCGWHIAISDTRMMAETYGKDVAIIGNLDCIADILERSPESLYERAVQDAMAGAPSGRFILSSDCDISPKTSDENMRAIVRAARDVQKKLDAEGWHYTDSKEDVPAAPPAFAGKARGSLVVDKINPAIQYGNVATSIQKHEISETGAFVRQKVRFDTPFGEGEGKLPVEPNRYRLIWTSLCPWATRQKIVFSLLGLDKVISIGCVNPVGTENGWEFSLDKGGVDPYLGIRYLPEVYARTDPAYKGRATVPAVVDLQSGKVVNNDYYDMTLQWETAWKKYHRKGAPDLYPVHLREEINALNRKIFDEFNNGVYKAGFAESQEEYEKNYHLVFHFLDWLEERLNHGRYLFGSILTDSDVRLFVTLARFDTAYYFEFHLNKKRIRDYHNIWNYARDLYSIPAFREATDFEAIKRGYLNGRHAVNPYHIIPLGPDNSGWDEPNDRAFREYENK